MNEHWKFLDEYVAKNGYFCIVDALEDEFGLTKQEAIAIYEPWKKAHPNPKAEAEIKAVGHAIGADIEKALAKLFEE